MKGIETGVYAVAAPCPRCRQVEQVLVAITTALTTPLDGIPSLRVRLKGKPVDHDCKQILIDLPDSPEGLTVDPDTGEVLGP